jgi:hypothetical protein
MIILEILNWCACGFTMLGGYEQQRDHPRLLFINIVYFLGTIIFIPVTIYSFDWAKLTMYSVYLIFTIRGILKQRKYGKLLHQIATHADIPSEILYGKESQ